MKSYFHLFTIHSSSLHQKISVSNTCKAACCLLDCASMASKSWCQGEPCNACILSIIQASLSYLVDSRLGQT